MDAYHVVISEIVLGKPHPRQTYTVMLPRVGTITAARAWLQTDVWPEISTLFPGRQQTDFRVDYMRLTELTWS